MRQTLRAWATLTLMILTWVMQFNIVTDYKASKYLKEEMELALHDAGLYLNRDQLAQGFVIFDKPLAYDAFVKGVELNTKLTNLEPTATTFFQDRFRIITFEVFDDSNTTFPYEYVSLSGYKRIFYSPSIYVVIETYGPRYFQGDKTLLRREASYTYKR